MCTYCSAYNGLVLNAIRYAWKGGEPWEKVEVLTGKSMEPAEGMGGRPSCWVECMYNAHKDNPKINRMIAIKGCPPTAEEVLAALHEAGIDADPSLFEQIDSLPGLFMARYDDKPEFDESFFRVEG